jgi:hypothetical protein
MAYNVQFLKGTEEGYTNLAKKDANTFYYTGSNLYLGEIKLSSAADLADALTRISFNEGQITNLTIAIGDFNNLKTTPTADLITAINEVFDIATNAASSSEITLTTATTPTDGYLKTYVLSQNNEEVGKIDIPKDLVVTSGEVVVNPEGQEEGTYIKLTIANQEAPIYINVKSLVDAYTTQSSAAQVQLAISDTNEISATIVAGSVGTTELADSAVTTAKIADGNVIKDKLNIDVQESLNKADTAVQSVTIGSMNGAISVDGINVSIPGLGSAAYVETTDFDAAGTATDKIAELDATVSQAASEDNGNIAVTVVETDGKLTSVTASIASGTYETSGAAATAESNAKSYVDTALTWQTF